MVPVELAWWLTQLGLLAACVLITGWKTPVQRAKIPIWIAIGLSFASLKLWPGQGPKLGIALAQIALIVWCVVLHRKATRGTNNGLSGS